MSNPPLREQTEAKNYIYPSFLVFQNVCHARYPPDCSSVLCLGTKWKQICKFKPPRAPHTPLTFSITLTCERLYVALSTLSCVSQVYVSENNIFLKSDVTAEAVQVTTNGKRNEILNGIPDWVYEGKHHRLAGWHHRAAWYLLDYCSYLQRRAVKWY